MLQRTKSILFGALLGILISSLALGQTATLMPNAKQQYLDDSGNPVSSGTAGYYVPGSTTTKKTVWQDSGKVTPQTNPVPLDVAGRPQPAGQTYGDGCYQQVVKDVNNVQVWSAVTCSTGASGGGTAPAFSEGVMVGTVVMWTNTTLPAKYLYTAGQAVSRSTYSQLLTAITYQPVVLCVSGIATITVSQAISDSTPIGAPIEVSCFAPGTTVLSKSSGQLTMSSNATATASVTAQLFPWGNGDGATTFNVPDYRGVVPAGRDNMNGSVAGRLTAPFFSGNNPDAVNVLGGAQSRTLFTNELPPYTPSGTIANGAISSTTSQNGNSGAVCGVGTGATIGLCGITAISISSTQGTSTLLGTPQGGTSTPFSSVQPTRTTDYIIKALPDDTPAGPGVTSIQSMTGAIACGSGLTCNAQTITVNNPTNVSIANVFSFGAIAGDMSAFATNMTALQSAFATGLPVYCPAGNIFYTQPISIPTNAQSIYGGCELFATGTYAGVGPAVLYGTGNANLVIRDITVFVPSSYGLTVGGIGMASNTNLLIDHVVASGANAIADSHSTGTVIRDSQVPVYTNIGILSTSGVHTKILNNHVANAAGVSINNPPFFCIQANIGNPGDPGSDVLIQGNTTVNCGNGFGINVNGNDPTQYEGVTVDNNKVYNTIVEGINLAGVKNFTMSNNYATFGPTHVDQGIDTWGPSATLRADNGTITGNTVVNACAGGIAMDQYSSNVTITGNIIINPNTCNSSAGNANAAIVLWNSTRTGVFGNTVTDPSGHTKWMVNEFNDGTTTQTPDFNTIGENAGPNGSLGRYNLIGANSSRGENCVYALGASTCNGDPRTQAAVFGSVVSNGAITSIQSINGNLFNTVTNTNAGSSAIAAVAATSNAGSIIMQANSTAAGGAALVTSALPLTIGSTGVTSLGTAGTLPIDATGLLKAATGKFAINGGSATAGLATVSAAGVINSAANATVAQGGTGGTSASGTLLDNITGFSSTGFINRTGAGAYSFTAPGTGVATALSVNVGTAGSFVVNGGVLGSPSSVGTLPAHTVSGNLTSTATTASATGGSTGAIATLGGISAAKEIYGLRMIAYGAGGITTNLAIGGNTLGSNTTGSNNVAVGASALSANITGNNNIAVGQNALTNSLGDANVGIGTGAGSAINTGIANTIIGGNSPGSAITSSNGNTLIGYNTATTLTGANNTIIGASVTVSAAANANTIVIADGSGQPRFDYGNTTASVNTITGALAATGLTNVATTSALCYNTTTKLITFDGTIGTCTVSDERLKNMGPRIDHALNKLLRIDGVNYTWRDPSYGSGPQIGVGAQTVEKVFPELVQTGSDGYKSVDYQRMVAPIIEAMRELKSDNDDLRACQQNWKCRIFGR